MENHHQHAGPPLSKNSVGGGDKRYAQMNDAIAVNTAYNNYQYNNMGDVPANTGGFYENVSPKNSPSSLSSNPFPLFPQQQQQQQQQQLQHQQQQQLPQQYGPGGQTNNKRYPPIYNMIHPPVGNFSQPQLYFTSQSKSHSHPEIRTPGSNPDDSPFRSHSYPASVVYPTHSHTPFYPHMQNSRSAASSFDLQQYPDMTTMVNSNSNIVLPMVESTFVDHKICNVCGKRISRDMSRHMRIHQKTSRFQCKFPKDQCSHKSGKFNRPYDYKKHSLNRHFKFDNPDVKKLHNLNDKLNHWGSCPCGARFTGKDWLDKHILTNDDSAKCPLID